MTEIKASIKTPCTEDWENMKIGLHSRFCDSCQHNVMDFTNKSRNEILEYLLANFDKRTCGRVYTSQLDFHHSDFLITIKTLSKKHNDTNLSFYLLTLGALILSGCDNSETNNGVLHFERNTITVQAKEKAKPIVQANTDMLQIPKKKKHKRHSKNKITTTLHESIFVAGNISIFNPEKTVSIEKTSPLKFAEVMPQFRGGLEGLSDYINQNLNYPNWEWENNIQGVVYVRFVVDKFGEIHDESILRSVEKSKNFDNEVLRVVKNMPDWIPGMHEGEPVDVEFYLPINFKLVK